MDAKLMKRAALSAGALLLLSGFNPAAAQCALPYQLTNSQLGDATKVMANFKALVSCFAPGGATNSIEYRAPGTGLGGVGPLANGQLAIGATGGALQAKTLTAGASIAIASGGAAPTAPYKITALIAATRSSTSYNGVGTVGGRESRPGCWVLVPRRRASENPRNRWTTLEEAMRLIG